MAKNKVALFSGHGVVDDMNNSPQDMLMSGLVFCGLVGSIFVVASDI